MLVLDLFSAAAGGWSLGLHRAGFTTIAACEAVAWRRALYAENNPGVRIYDDVRTLDADQLIRDLGCLPDAIVGSPPCQDISSANTKGKGVEGERSGLYFEAIRLVRECRPRWFAFENSSNLRTRGADRVLGELEGLGYACWPFVVRAGDIGANHPRPRSWIIGFDPRQLADADGEGRAEEWRRWRRGLDLSDAQDPDERADDGHASQERCGPRRTGRRAGPASGLPVAPRRHANDADAHGERRQDGGVDGVLQSPPTTAPDRPDRRRAAGLGNPADAHEAGQADGCVVAGLRPAEIADDGCGDERRDDVPDTDTDSDSQPDQPVDAEMGGREGAGVPAAEPWADWNGGLAHHLRVDDGLSAWVAGTRIAEGGPKGTAAASLIVEAFGDAVVPQIPEAIGRAMLRVETAMAVITGAAAP